MPVEAKPILVSALVVRLRDLPAAFVADLCQELLIRLRARFPAVARRSVTPARRCHARRARARRRCRHGVLPTTGATVEQLGTALRDERDKCARLRYALDKAEGRTSDGPPYECPHCQKLYQRYGALRNHLTHVHTQAPAEATAQDQTGATKRSVTDAASE